MGSVKIRQLQSDYQSDYQESLELSEIIRSGFPGPHPEARSAPKDILLLHNVKYPSWDTHFLCWQKGEAL